MIPKTLLDTDILSRLMRRNPQVLARAQLYLNEHSCFTFSLITKYEVLRGLKAKTATRQLQNFELFCENNEILNLSDDIVELASDTYADLHRRGLKISDADILIAATALSHDLVLSTNNINHFGRIAPLRIDNWAQP